MTAEPLELLRASNPVPRGSTAPPIERVLERIRGERPAPRRWRSTTRTLMPLVGSAAAVAVVAVVVLATHHRSAVKHAHPATKSTVSTTPSPVPARPTDGMRGFVSIQGAGFASPRVGVISIQQCLGCREDGNQTAGSTDSYWLARTADAGRTWRLTKVRYALLEPQFVGQDGWAGGLQAQGSQAGGIAEYYVTHDGGRSWRVAPAAAPNEGGALVSVGGGEVWATGLTPATVTILHAPVAGSRLTATASQPIHGDFTNVDVIAGGPGTAYVSNEGQMFVTHDDGRSWHRTPQPCPRGDQGSLATAHGDTVWAECSSPGSRLGALARSDDGGDSWQQLKPAAAPTMLETVSAEAAWALSGIKVLRTTDGGSTWRIVWSGAASEPPSLRSQAPPPLVAGFYPLIAQTTTAANIVTILAGGGAGAQAKYTNLVVYRTTDGGATWHPSVVPLAAR